MPGVDFQRLRTDITMQQVLDLLGFEAVHCTGDQWSGPCPLCPSTSRRNRCFSVHVTRGRYYCHRCKSHGNQLELWAAATHRPLYQAALDLCRQLGCDVPWIRRWRSTPAAQRRKPPDTSSPPDRK